MFTWKTTQSLLNPTLGKSAQSVSVESTSTLWRNQVPVGSLVADAPIRIPALAVSGSSQAKKSQRPLIWS